MSNSGIVLLCGVILCCYGSNRDGCLGPLIVLCGLMKLSQEMTAAARGVLG